MNRRAAITALTVGSLALALAPQARAQVAAAVPGRSFRAPDGVRIHYRDAGSGMPVLLMHGFTADGEIAWGSTGVMQALLKAGRRVVAPDWRGHGRSEAPDDPRAYPPDCVPNDHAALIEHLGFEDGAYDIVGYSYGGHVAARLLARGAKPRRALLGGIGIEGIIDVARRRRYFEDGIRGVDPNQGRPLREFMARTGMKPQAALHVLGSLISTPAGAFAQVRTPVLVLAGEEDFDFGSAEALAALFSNGRCLRVPGTHMSTPWTPRFVPEILAFLA